MRPAPRRRALLCAHVRGGRSSAYTASDDSCLRPALDPALARSTAARRRPHQRKSAVDRDGARHRRREPRGDRARARRGARGAADLDGVARRAHACGRPREARRSVPPRACRRRVQGVEVRAMGRAGRRRDLPRRDPAVREREREARAVAARAAREVPADGRGREVARGGGRDPQHAHFPRVEGAVFDEAHPRGPVAERVDGVRARVVHGALDPACERVPFGRRSGAFRRGSALDGRVRQPLVGRGVGRRALALHGRGGADGRSTR